jgi:hypothetical protein
MVSDVFLSFYSIFMNINKIYLLPQNYSTLITKEPLFQGGASGYSEGREGRVEGWGLLPLSST